MRAPLFPSECLMRFYLVQFHLELEVVGEAGAHGPDFTQGSFWELEVSH